MPNQFSFHLFDAVTEQMRGRPSLKHVELLSLKFCSSLKPLTHNNLALINFPSSTNFSR